MKLLPALVLAGLMVAAPLHAQGLDEARANLHDAYDSLMANLAEQEKLAQDIERLTAEAAKQRKALEPDTQRVADLRAKVDAAKAANSPDLQTAEMRLKVAEIEYRGLSENLTSQEKALENASARMKSLETSAQSEIQKVQQLRKQVAELTEKEKAANSRRESARSAELEKLKDELITLKINLQETQAEKDTLAARATTLQEELDTLKAQPCDLGVAPVAAGNVGAGMPTPAPASATTATTVTAANQAPATASNAPEDDAPAATGNLQADLAARLKARNMDKATRKSGRYLYIKTTATDGKTYSQTYPWLAVDRNYYTLEAEMKAGDVTLTFGSQRQTITVPAADDGATYVFVLENATKDDAKLGYFHKAP